jgi:hypothetical protein
MFNNSYHNVKQKIPEVIEMLRKVNPPNKYESRAIGEAMSLLLIFSDILESATSIRGDNNE